MPDTLRMAGALVGGHTHREEDLLDGALYARLAADEVITGAWGFPAAGISIGQEVISSPSTALLGVSGALNVSGGLGAGGDLDVVGSVTAGGGLDVGGDLDVAGGVTVTGALGVEGVAAIGDIASVDPDGRQALRVQHYTGDCSIWNHGAGGYFRPEFNTTTQGFAFGILGGIRHTGAAGGSYMAGLRFEAIQEGAHLNWMHGIRMDLLSYAGGGTISDSYGLWLYSRYQGSKPSTFRGIYIEGHDGMSTVEVIRIEDFTGTTIRLLEIGPATPYLRLVGGASPGAGQTNLYLYEGSTPALRRVQWKAGDTLGASDRVLVLV